MRVSNDHPLARTHALLRPATARAAVENLRGHLNRAAIEGLVELLGEPRSAQEALAAISVLEDCPDPMVQDALTAALDSPHASVRLDAITALHERRSVHAADLFRRLLRADESWMVRRAALRALADGLAPDRWCVLDAATDPHWRVRHALIEVLLGWGASDEQRKEIAERLTRLRSDARIQGVRAYLDYRWTGSRPLPESIPDPVNPHRLCPFWDWDVAVLVRNLERMGEKGRRQALDAMPFLLGHADSRVRSLSGETLRAWGEARHLVQALEWLDDPRRGAADSVRKWLAQFDLDRIEAAARFLLHTAKPSAAQLAWAVDQVGVAVPVEEEEVVLCQLIRESAAQSAEVRCALARLAARWEHPESERWLWHGLVDPEPEVQVEALRGLNRRNKSRWAETVLAAWLASPSAVVRAEAVKTVIAQQAVGLLRESLAQDPAVCVRLCLAECLAGPPAPWAEPLLARLQADPHPHVRAAALTEKQAAELIENPVQETSWYVLARAARLRRVPLWELAPEQPWQPVQAAPTGIEPLPAQARPDPIPHVRFLGPAKLAVAPLGISGHYGLPVEGFVRATEAGVNLFFWEPNYQTLTEFATRLPALERNALYFLAGTFEADGERIRRDAERALRMLKIDCLALFLLFWVQSWERVTPDVHEALERLREQGLIAMFGLSTHSRPLAIEAMEVGWNPVMVRHSAAHRGAEERIFPRAAELGTSLLTFNNTCYSRLLKSHGGFPPPAAADCYRYTLEQPGVTMCLSAPATREQLEENLHALRDPLLPDERRGHLLRCGALVYEEDTVFRKLVRSL